MRTLYILRHAKSSWEDSALRDFDRPLNERGVRSAKLIGGYLRSTESTFTLVVSSPARRTAETTNLVLASGQYKVPVKNDNRIYEASLPQLLAVIEDIDDQNESVLLVGHNPGMEQLVECLTMLERRMPTAALAKVELNVGSWRSVQRGIGELDWYVTPKTLPA